MAPARTARWTCPGMWPSGWLIGTMSCITILRHRPTRLGQLLASFVSYAGAPGIAREGPCERRSGFGIIQTKALAAVGFVVRYLHECAHGERAHGERAWLRDRLPRF